jgi:choline dehydrogenase-like flavoprotein
MLVDARTVPKRAALEADVCIVGGGGAGIALARALGRGSTSVFLLESGGFEWEAETQALYDGVSTGTILGEDDPYLTGTRVRAFGGTTNVWGGWCAPLNAIDFELRPGIAHSGWPVSRADLDPWYSRAARVLEIPGYDEDPGERAAAIGPILLADSPRVDTQFFRFSPPTYLGMRYRDELVRSQQASVFLHANVLELRANANRSRIESASVACLDGNRFLIKAKEFIVAAGAIENARLLLLSNRVQKAGLGNDHDLVGRYFGDHPHLDVGHLALSEADREMKLYSLAHPVERDGILGVFSIKQNLQRRRRLLSLRLLLRPVEPAELAALDRAVARSAAKLDGVATNRASDAAPLRLYALNASCEVTPDPESRVTLIDDVDALGQRRVRVDWRMDPADNASLRESVEILARELGGKFQGRAQLYLDDETPWPAALPGHHHSGTTRMHPDPTKGVVDADCRVHGIDNLHIAGGSVFPTNGYANPTLTIVALALRLADRIQRRSA